MSEDKDKTEEPTKSGENGKPSYNRREDGTFGEGNNANPDGPPKWSLISILKEQLQGIPEGQKETRAKMFIDAIMAKALRDNDHATQKMILNYIEGMPPQGIDLTSLGQKVELGVIILPQKDED